MKKSTKIIALILAFVLAMSASAAVTVALLTDTDSKVNTMVVGNVDIEQTEWQRQVVNGEFVTTGQPDQYGYTPDVLEEFEQDKLWIPVTDKNVGWDSRQNGTHQQSWGQINAEGSNQLFDGEQKNVIDKFVFVENTGKSDAYYRTIIAIETPEGLGGDYIHINCNANTRFDYNTKVDGVQATDQADIVICTINGVRYAVYTATYTPILTPGEVSRPSLLQVYLDYYATNKDVALFGEKMDILVLSQAVQAAGFDSAAQGLDDAFGVVNATNVNKWFNGTVPEDVNVSGNNKAAVLTAIEAAQPGDTVVLTEDTTISGYAANEKLVIDKPITLDLNGKTLTTESGWGGIDLKGGASIVNGTINHTGNTAAIKAFQVGTIENVTINVTETAGKTKGGIVVQEGADCYVGSIKNVTIIGATNGIETYRCGARSDYAIGYMENVTIDATGVGMQLSAPIGNVVNCSIEGDNIGVEAYLYGPYSVTANLVKCQVTGGNAAIYAHDEVGKTNPGSLEITYDAATVITGAITQEFETEVSGRVSVTQK